MKSILVDIAANALEPERDFPPETPRLELALLGDGSDALPHRRQDVDIDEIFASLDIKNTCTKHCTALRFTFNLTFVQCKGRWISKNNSLLSPGSTRVSDHTRNGHIQQP